MLHFPFSHFPPPAFLLLSFSRIVSRPVCNVSWQNIVVLSFRVHHCSIICCKITSFRRLSFHWFPDEPSFPYPDLPMQRISFKLAITVYKCLNVLAPPYLVDVSGLLTCYVASRWHLRSADSRRSWSSVEQERYSAPETMQLSGTLCPIRSPPRFVADFGNVWQTLLEITSFLTQTIVRLRTFPLYACVRCSYSCTLVVAVVC